MAIDRVYVDGDYVQFRDSAGDFVTAIHYSEFSYFNDNGDIKFLHRRDQAALYPITSVNFLDVKDASGTPYVTAPQDLDDFLAAFIALLPTVGGGGGGGTAPDIATYELQVDADNANEFVRVLTTFDPITNAPTRTFFELDGITPYVPADASLVITPDYLIPTIEEKLSNLSNGAKTSNNSQFFANTYTTTGAPLTVTIPPCREVVVTALSGTFSVTDGATNLDPYPKTTVGGGIIAQFSLRSGDFRNIESFDIVIDDASSVHVIWRN